MPLVLNGTTGVSGVDGSAGTPALRGTDADSGVYFTGSQVGFSTNGAGTTMTMDASGNVTFPGTVVMSSPFAMRNKIINGAMEIAQRGTSAVTVNSASRTYALDRFFGYGESADGVFTIQQDTLAPAGFVNSAKVTVTTADASVGASQLYLFAQSIEGLNTVDLAWGTSSARTITMSFWVRSSLTGTFGGAINNSNTNRSYPFSYNITVANTWEFKTITIPGDITGTWLTTNGVGINIWFDMGSGSSVIGTAGSWSSNSFWGATGSTRLINTLNATWNITGLQFEVGSVATPFERRLYSQELAMCQRYYMKMINTSVYGDFGNAANYSVVLVYAPVPMRATPSFSATSSSGAFGAQLNLTNYLWAAYYVVVGAGSAASVFEPVMNAEL